MKFPNSSLSRSPLRLFVARILLAIVISLVAGLARAQTLYVSSGPGSIDTISATGVVSPFATLPYAATPTSLAFDSAGNLYAADYGSNQIYKITPGGAVSLFATLLFTRRRIPPR